MATTDNRLPTEGTQIDIEARLAAIETALASLMADTTGQSIASAISGLGQTLGSDKANISGDNIADKATFRQNIEINKVFYPTRLPESDLNTCIAGGIYRANRATLNAPLHNYYVVITIVYNENVDVVQVAIDVLYATLFVRSFHDGTTWTAWKRCDNV